MNRKTSDKAMILAIHICTWLTVILLVLILGYVAFRGIWKRSIVEDDMVPGTTSGFVVAGNFGKEISWSDLRRVARGRVPSWRSLTGNNLVLSLCIDDSVRPALAKALGLKASEIVTTEALPTHPQKGSMVIASSAPKGFHLLSVKNMVLAVNPAVAALRGNQQLRAVDKETLEKLLAGSIGSWGEIGGPDTPVVKADGLDSLLANEGAFLMMEAAAFTSLPEGSVSFLKVREATSGPNLTMSFLMEDTIESGKYGGIRTILLNTIIFILLVALVSAPLGIASAVYLEEYSKRGKAYQVVSAAIDILNGIPSIIFGLFGMLVFVEKFHWSFCLASGTLTVSLMVLPTIVRTSQDAIHSVPRALREGSLALGATRVETIWKVVLPAAKRGIVTGMILAIGRAVGETAALIYTVGSGAALATSPMMPARTLAMHIYLTITEGQGLDKAFATALVLMVLVCVFDFAANRLAAGREHT